MIDGAVNMERTEKVQFWEHQKTLPRKNKITNLLTVLLGADLDDWIICC